MTEVTTFEFFEQVHGVDAPGHRVILTLPNPSIYWFEAADIAGAVACIERVADNGNTYYNVGLQEARLAKGRGEASTVCAWSGPHVDLDIAHPIAHKGDRLPPDRDAAWQLLADFPLPPSVVTDSGYGLQPQWLLEELFVFNGNGDAARAAELSRRFQATFATSTGRRGWRIDATHDLARVLRVPGTWNMKVPGSPAAVFVAEWHPERRYSIDELESHLLEPEPTGRRTASPVDDSIGEGERNATLASLAGSMRRRNMTREAIEAALLAENVRKCEPPLTDDEVRAIAASVAGYDPAAHPPRWPKLNPAALHGLAGEVVRAIEPYSEADAAAVLSSFVATYGCAVGFRPHAMAGDVTHPPRVFVVIVGETAKARKGTSGASVHRIFVLADPTLMRERAKGGFGSGEAVVDEVRDPEDEDDSDAPGDHRLLIVEPELARLFRVAQRDGSILSMTTRNAWDGIRLEARTRRSKVVATRHHIVIIGHVTEEELRRSLSDLEVASGFANRFLYVCARRSKRLPFDNNVPDAVVRKLADKVAESLRRARQVGRLDFTPPARPRWAELYGQMADDDPMGLLGALVARPEPQVLRLAVAYALLDGRDAIDLEHLEAAWALWSYSRASAEYIFGDALGDPVGDRLLAAIRTAGPEGLSFTDQSAALGRNVPGKALGRAREVLEARGLIVTEERDSGGRPTKVSIAVAHTSRELGKGEHRVTGADRQRLGPTAHTKETKETKEGGESP